MNNQRQVCSRSTIVLRSLPAVQLIIMKLLITLIALGLANTAAVHAQKKNNLISRSTNTTIMNTAMLTNPVVKKAIDAFQAGDRTAWLALFTADVQLFDDGNTRNFKNFSEEALGHEHFVTIDKVEHDGLHVYGRFHSDQWGDFKAYFKFTINPAGKVAKLEIGQATY